MSSLGFGAIAEDTVAFGKEKNVAAKRIITKLWVRKILT
jgi:hypothetical protein